MGPMPLIAVVGSLNMDLVARAPRLPMAGETVLGQSFQTFPGGKGANQAVAAARAGGHVHMIGCVGDDAFGDELLAVLRREGVDSQSVRRLAGPSGVALIVVGGDGENAIVVVPGANQALRAEDVSAAEAVLTAAAYVLIQLEIPREAVFRAIELAHAGGARVILDPAPAPREPWPRWAFERIDLMTPNEHEARALVGDPSATPEACAARLAALGVRTAIVTLGAEGVVWATAAEPERVRRAPAFPARAVDTTGAGDAFAGALAVALAEGKPLELAIAFAQAGAALAVTRPGAQASLPRRAEIDALLAGTGEGGGPFRDGG